MTRWTTGSLKFLTLVGLTTFATAGFAQTSHNNVTEIAAYFQDADLVNEPKIVDCTLSGGAQTKCFSITVKADPQSYTPGPWCPSNIADGAEAGGIWLKDGEVHDVDGSFIKNLAELYVMRSGSFTTPTQAMSASPVPCRPVRQPHVRMSIRPTKIIASSACRNTCRKTRP